MDFILDYYFDFGLMGDELGFVLDGFPGWREVLSLPVPERLTALADPAVRERLHAGARSEEAGMLRGLANWGQFEVLETFTAANDGLEGRRIADIASQRGERPFDVLLDIVVADDLRTGLRPFPVSERREEFYVCPKTGLLREARVFPRKERGGSRGHAT